VRFDESGGERGADERACADARDGDAEGGGATLLEPAADHRHHRHIAAGDRGADSEAVGDIAEPDRSDGRGGEQPEAEADRADDHHRPRPVAVGEPSGDDSTSEVEGGGDREHESGQAASGVELLGHRVEERAEGVGDAEHGERREERSGDGSPSADLTDYRRLT
jgi:hypothetical protein